MVVVDCVFLCGVIVFVIEFNLGFWGIVKRGIRIEKIIVVCIDGVVYGGMLFFLVLKKM